MFNEEFKRTGGHVSDVSLLLEFQEDIVCMPPAF